MDTSLTAPTATGSPSTPSILDEITSPPLPVPEPVQTPKDKEPLPEVQTPVPTKEVKASTESQMPLLETTRPEKKTPEKTVPPTTEEPAVIMTKIIFTPIMLSFIAGTIFYITLILIRH